MSAHNSADKGLPHEGMNIRTRFGLGDTAWLLRSSVARDKESCEMCGGSGRIQLRNAAGEPIEVSQWSGRDYCPECGSNGYVWLDTNHHEATITRLTIGQVRTEATTGQTDVSYMAEETGVGSGSVYREPDLHPSREDAIDAFFAAHPSGVLKSVDRDPATVIASAEGDAS